MKAASEGHRKFEDMVARRNTSHPGYEWAA